MIGALWRKRCRLVISLLNLKSPNGMLYFVADYAQLLPDNVVIVAPKFLVSFCREIFRQKDVIDVGRFGFFRLWMYALVSRVAVFCPTPHPMPFVSRQLIVVHDSYPFRGRMGRLKYWLFCLSTKTSRCRVAYINNSDSLRFVQKTVADESRHLFLPNHWPVAHQRHVRRYRGGKIFAGLLGTDSSKKNYASLFERVLANSLHKKIEFVIFGNETTYFKSICEAYPEIKIRLARSSEVELHEFLEQIDCIVSVAGNEGFCRPIAYALSAGVPSFLIEDEVFREFYDGLARFAPSIDVLLGEMAQVGNYSSSVGVHFPPQDNSIATGQGLNAILQLGSYKI